MRRGSNRLASSRRLGSYSGPHYWRPAFEPLEDRRLLSAVVINTLDSGAGSLRQAILDTNATLGLDNITFNIPGAGPHTITLLSSLPTITDPVFINGASEPGFAGSPVIELDGGGVVSTGLRIESGGSTVRGLAIGNFGNGIELDLAGGNQVVGNYIGVDADGVTARPNSLRGISVTSDGNSIGGTVPQDRNVISDNTNIGIYIASSDAIQIRGNYIGLLPDGVTAAGNFTGVHVIGTASNVTIGGTTVAARNVISGNAEGVYIDSQGANNVVQGNYLGVGADGTTAVANVDGVVVFTGATNVTVGGTVPGAGNVFVNSKTGIWVFSADGTQIQGNYIGVLADGVTAAANIVGVQVDGTASNTTIGGTTSGARNVISGNGTGIRSFSTGANNVVRGNFIGLGADGLTVVPNLDGIYVQDGGFTIGGLVPGARNVIVGNTNNGVWLSSTDNVQVQGNYIGVLPDGVTAAGNPNNGVALDVAADNTTIGGTAAEARNIISGNGAGISTFGLGLNNVVQGNYIGIGADGVTVVANLDGIHVHDDGLTIGGVVPGARNVISGNTLSGVLLDSATGVQVQGNTIGLLPDGVTAAGNYFGVLLQGTASNNTIGGSNPAARNIISANTYGVCVQDASLNNTIRGNSIYANAQLGIDLGFDGPTPNDVGDADSGPHGLQNVPVITAATVGAATHVVGTIASTANTTFDIDFYANAAAGLSGLGEGERFLGSVTVITDVAGNAGFDVNGLGASLISEFITATATGPQGTSEFSQTVPPPVISMDANVVHNEGDTGTNLFVFTVRLSSAAPADATVAYATADGTAKVADNDYAATSGFLTFAPGETSKTITVAVTGDVQNETDETFSVNLTAGTSVVLPPGPALGTIVNDDGPRSLSVGDLSQKEGNSSTTTFVFAVNLSAASAQTVKVAYATADGTAKVSDADYTAKSGTLTFAPGITRQLVTVLVKGDTKLEDDETFSLRLLSPSGAVLDKSTAVGTIVNDDAAPTLSVQGLPHLEGKSGTTKFVFTAFLTLPSTERVTLAYATADGTATVADNDYQPTSGTVTFAPGETRRTFTVLVKGDSKFESSETFSIKLSNPIGAKLKEATVTTTIVNDDISKASPAATAQNSVAAGSSTSAKSSVSSSAKSLTSSAVSHLVPTSNNQRAKAPKTTKSSGRKK